MAGSLKQHRIRLVTDLRDFLLQRHLGDPAKYHPSTQIASSGHFGTIADIAIAVILQHRGSLDERTKALILSRCIKRMDLFALNWAHEYTSLLNSISIWTANNQVRIVLYCTLTR